MRWTISLAAAVVAAALFGPAASGGTDGRVEVVVTLDAPPLGRAVASSRVLSARTKARRLDLRAPTSVAYLRSLRAKQQLVTRRIRAAIPSARVRWRYTVVLNGLAVVVPRTELRRLARVPGVARVWPSTRYSARLDRSPEIIGADRLWGLPDYTSAGQGLKIGIIDDGIDPSHPFFAPAGFTPPPGYPKGNTRYTTGKIIAARAFAPPSPAWRFAGEPFDPIYSEHGTHVAGIAAGNVTPPPVAGRGVISGVAPRAYLGNYKVLTIPTENFGLDGNAPEIAAGIEAAVRDGMDVINLSLGEPEIEPARDVVTAAIDGAADAGVVPTIAAGNDFDGFGRGSLSSPGSAAKAITAAAVSKANTVASFSSSGPTPLSLRLKPDVAAPGVSILSSVPSRAGTWAAFSGTSMAAPHIAGAAALLRQHHPEWTVAQIKSALVLTADPAFLDGSGTEAPTTREGGGLVNLARATDPRIFAAPTSFALGLVKLGTGATGSVELTDAGGGAGAWSVTVQEQVSDPAVSVTAPTTVTVPGRLELSVAAAAGAPEQDFTGFVVLQLGDQQRRLPYWFRTTDPKLGRARRTVLPRPGVYTGNTRGKPSLVSAYRYPDDPSGAGVTDVLRGPEQVFRVRIRQRVANFGVVVLSQGRGVRIHPRVVSAGDENRLTGYAALPLDINPYLSSYGRLEPIAGAISPSPGLYDVVFDTAGPRQAGRFRFRFWVNDVSPPTVKLLTRSTTVTGRLLVAVADAGAGINPGSIRAELDNIDAPVTYSAKTGRATVLLGGQLSPGRHTLTLQVSDNQETKNMENVGPILPNTRIYRAAFTITG